MINARVPHGASQEQINEAIKKVWKSGLNQGQMVGVGFYEPMRVGVSNQIKQLTGSTGESKPGTDASEEERK